MEANSDLVNLVLRYNMIALEDTNDPGSMNQRDAEATLLVLDGLRIIVVKFESVSSGRAVICF